MSTEVIDNPAKRRYELFVDDVLAGRADYELRDGRIAIVHVEVESSRAGRGLGGKLVDAVLADARARGLRVLPSCPFALHVIAAHQDDYLDLVPADERERFGLPSARATRTP
jgi:uncharacterized protein